MQLVTYERSLDTNDDGEPRRSRHASMGDAALGFEALESLRPGLRRMGAVLPAGSHGGSVVDLNRALAIKLASDDGGAPEAEADSLLPADLLELLRRGPGSMNVARAALAFAVEALDRYDAPDLLRAGVVHARRDVRLCAPIPRPGKIVGVARNYPAHAAERGGDVPEEPVLFLKAPSSVIGPEDEIRLPRASDQVDYEGELAVIIGTAIRGAGPDEALACVAGYCVANDVSARDYQGVRGQRFIGKSCDTFAPLGPTLVTADEIPDPQDLGIRTTVSQQGRQSGHTKQMHFGVGAILSFASRLMTLEPGDVVLTGTPAGVGSAAEPPRWLRDGDVVEVEIDRVGRLRNYVREEPAAGA